MKITMLNVLLILGSTLFLGKLFACQCAEESFEDQNKYSKNIFVGKLIDISPIEEDGFENRYKFEVLGTWKGSYKDTVVFALGNSSCHYIYFTLNDTYVLYDGMYGGLNKCNRIYRYKLSPDIDSLNKKYNKNIHVPNRLLLADELTNNEAKYINDNHQAIGEVLANKKYLFAQSILDNLIVSENKFSFFKDTKDKYKCVTVIQFNQPVSCNYHAILYFSNEKPTAKQINYVREKLKNPSCL